MRLGRVYILIFLLFTGQINGGLFDGIFGGNKESSKVIIEDAVEEEIISADEYLDSADEPMDIEVFSQDPLAFDEDEESIDDSLYEDVPLVRTETLFLSYLLKPEKIYLTQKVKITLKAVVTHNKIERIKTTFLKSSGVEILNPNATWVNTADNSYEVSYIFKFLSTDGVLPDFKVSTYSSRGILSSKVLPSYNPKIVALREDKEFSLVLSTDFTLKNHSEKKHDEKSNIILLDINATDANLEDFHIPYSIKDGIYEIKESANMQSIYYFAIIPNDIKVFKFKYFDLLSNRYHIVTFPISLQDSTISTQTDLNPKKSRLALYKAIALLVIAFVIFLLFLKTKAFYLLILSLAVVLLLIYTQLPISKITLDKGIKLRILPTENSTIFYITKQELEADILLKKDGYIKVLLPNKKIGWINEDISKD